MPEAQFTSTDSDPSSARARPKLAHDKYHSWIPKFPMQGRHTRAGFFDDVMFAAVRDKLPEVVQPVVTFAYITGWRIQLEVLPLE